jgi:hypothetical protein
VTERSKWNLNIPLYSRLLLLVIFLTFTFLFSSCGDSKVNLAKSDIHALQNIYEEGNWTFQQSSVNVKVNEGGAIKLSIAGKAIEKVAGSDSSIWLPVALLKELPEYYGIDGDKSNSTKLISYKVKDGLWSIVALVPKSNNKTQIKESSSTLSQRSTLEISQLPQIRDISLEVLMISPTFTQSLPFNLPLGQGINSVQTSVELPPKAQFTSLLTRGNNESVKLTQLPLSISEGKIKALARLQPESAMIWDFSDVGYQLPTDKFSRQGLLNVAQWISSICAVAIAVWIGWEFWENRLLPRGRYPDRSYSIYRQELYFLRSRIELISQRERSPEGGYSIYSEEPYILRGIEELISRLRRYLDRGDREELYSLRNGVEELISQRRHYLDRGDREELYVEREIYNLMLQLRNCLVNILDERHSEEIESPEFRRKRIRFIFYTLVAVLIVAALVLLISSIGLSQEVKVNSKISNDSSLILSEFNFSVNSSDYNSDKVKATLSFYPLSTKPLANSKGQIVIDFGGNKFKLLGQNNLPDTVKVDFIPVDPTSQLIKYQVTNIPTKTVPDLRLLTAASKRGIQIDRYDNIADIYNHALKNDPKPVFINMEYEISDALTRKEQIPNFYFNWFPADKTLLEIPIKVDGATAIISQIEIDTPKDLHSHVQLSGIEQINLKLERNEKQDYKFRMKPGKNKFIVINSGNKVNLTGDYERHLPGKLVLTLVVAIVGGCIGLAIGYFSPDRRSLALTIAGIMGSSFLSFFAIIATNKDFQSIISIRGQISFFDVFLLLGSLSLIGTAILMQQCKINSYKSKNIIFVSLYFGLFSIVIPVILLIFAHP